MTEKFATIRPEWTVAETLDHLKRIDPEVETVQSLYAVDDAGRLVGYVSLRHLFPAPPDKKISEMMERRLLTVNADTPQEEVARLVSKYDLHAIPVVDEENRLLGIVTVDDVIDILIEEQTEDVLHMGGVSATEETVEQGYFATKPLRNVRLRFNWLLLMFVTETFTGTVLRHYESELAKVVALSFFIPLLIGTGGNSGSQTVTTIVRGLAVGEIRLRDFWRVLFREAGSGLVLGIMLGIVGFGRALLWGSTMPARDDRGRLDPRDLRLGQHGRIHDPDARDRLQDRPDRHVRAPDRDPRGRDRPDHLLHDRQELPGVVVARANPDRIARSKITEEAS